MRLSLEIGNKLCWLNCRLGCQGRAAESFIRLAARWRPQLKLAARGPREGFHKMTSWQWPNPRMLTQVLRCDLFAFSWWESHTQKRRSRRPNCGRFDRRRSRTSCCRSARFSNARSVRVLSDARSAPNKAITRDIASLACTPLGHRPVFATGFWQTTGPSIGAKSRDRYDILRIAIMLRNRQRRVRGTDRARPHPIGQLLIPSAALQTSSALGTKGQGASGHDGRE